MYASCRCNFRKHTLACTNAVVGIDANEDVDSVAVTITDAHVDVLSGDYRFTCMQTQLNLQSVQLKLQMQIQVQIHLQVQMQNLNVDANGKEM